MKTRPKTFIAISTALALLAGGAIAQQAPAQAPQPGSTNATSAAESTLPDDVVTFVGRQAMPANPVMIQQEIAVGLELPPEIVLSPIPDHPDYVYAVVNQRRLVVDPASRKVLQIVR